MSDAPNTPPAEPVPVVDARIYGSVRKEGAWECGASAFVVHETEDLPALAVPDALWGDGAFIDAVGNALCMDTTDTSNALDTIFAELARRAGRVG